jgi:hypothetical protein
VAASVGNHLRIRVALTPLIRLDAQNAVRLSPLKDRPLPQISEFDIMAFESQLLMHPPRHGVGLGEHQPGPMLLFIRFVEQVHLSRRLTNRTGRA